MKNTIRVTLLVLILFFITNIIDAQTIWSQIGSDIDGEAAGDESGFSVDFNSDGSIVAIGAIKNDGNGTDAGHVRVYEFNGSNWAQLGSDIDGEAAGDWFGRSVSLSSDGTILAVGATKNDGNGSESGHVRVFQYDGSNWLQIGSDIDGEAAGDWFGSSISLSSDGTILAAGAFSNNGNGIDAGHVRVYNYSGGIWTQLGSDIDGEAAGDQSGHSVSLSSNGNIVAIGASYNTNANDSCAGHVRVYEFSGGNWIQVGNDIDGEAAFDYSGNSVTLNDAGNYLAIGAPWNDGNGSMSGHVRVYEFSGGNWIQVGNDIDGEAIEDGFGMSTSLSSDGTILATGAKWNDGNGYQSGHVRVFEFSGGNWIQKGIDIDGEFIEDLSGDAICLNSDGSRIAINATYNDGNGIQSGQVRVFEFCGTTNTINESACYSYTSPSGNYTWTNSGTYLDTIPNYFGCDSIITINLSINNTYSSIYEFACNSYTSPSGNYIWTNPGIYFDTIPNIAGCDSIITIDLDINNTYSSFYDTSCYVYIAPSGAEYYFSGIYTDTIPNFAGCGDSIITINLTITPSLIFEQLGTDIDGENSGDIFGCSVSISHDGNIVAIGAPYNDDNGYTAGQVRIFNYSGGTWTQMGNDIYGDTIQDEFGYSISFSSDSNIVAIGAPKNDAGGTNSGHVRIFEYIAGNWIQLGNDINGEAQNDNSGCSVCLSANGNIVAIGANGIGTGHVKVYEFSGGNWIQMGSNINGEATSDLSGHSVSLSSDGNTIAIGAPHNNGNGIDAGHVRIYNFSGGVWTQVGLDIDGEAAGDEFGYSVSLNSDGTKVAIGAPYNNGNGTDAGHVRVYNYSGGIWVRIGNDIDGDGGWCESGYSVSLGSDGNTVAIGTPELNLVKIYKYTGSNWLQIGPNIVGENNQDYSGCSICLSSDGNAIAIGAKLNDGNGSAAGHARIYQINVKNVISGSANFCSAFTSPIGNVYTNPGLYYEQILNTNSCDSLTAINVAFASYWEQLGNDIDGEAADDQSGYSVSLSSDGNTVAIGAIANDGNGTNSGHVRIYENAGGNWVQKGNDINGEAIYDQFGYSVSLSSDGQIVAIGAPDNDGTGTDAGHVRVYEYVGSNWIQLGNDIDGEATGDHFGYSVSLSSDGNIIAIGAINNDGNGFQSGCVEVYNYSGGTWTQIGNDIYGEAASDASGCSVSLSSDGNTVAIGARANDGNGPSSGHVRIFSISGGIWTQLGNDIDGEEANDLFGWSVGLSSDGNTVAIGARTNNGNGNHSGHVRIFNYSGGVWTQIGKDIDGEAPNDESGYSVSISSDGNTVAIGARYNDGNGLVSGHVRIFSFNGIQWTQLSFGNDIDGEDSGDISGWSVSLSSDGNTVAIGAPGNYGSGTASGHVRVYNTNTVSNIIYANASCGDYISPNGNVYSNPGMYYEQISTISGCDSLYIIDLSMPEWNQLGNNIEGEPYSGTGVILESNSNVSLSADGNTVAIGDYNNDNNGTQSGYVRIFNYSGGTWTQLGGDIEGEETYSFSGHAVSLNADGTTVAIGAFDNTGNGLHGGHVRVFNYTGSTWTQIGNDIDGNTGDYSGWSVSLSSDGNTVAIGGLDNQSGHVKIYNYTGGNWTQIGGIIEGEMVDDRFGWSISLSSDGNTVAIGAKFNDGNGANSGHVRVFNYSGGAWTQLGSDIDGEATNDYSGWSVSLSSDGTIVAIGAPRNNGNGTYSGQVRVFQYNGSDWLQLGSDIDGEADGDQSGYSVSISSDGNTVAIGAPYHDGITTNSGLIRVFNYNGGIWEQILSNIDDGPLWIEAGSSVSISSDGYTVAGKVDIPGYPKSAWIYSIANRINETACNSYISPNGNVYTNSGIYYDTIPNPTLGCDSIYIINLSIGTNSTYSSISPFICQNNSYVSPSGNYIYTTSGIYSDTITNVTGCDSIITINLTVNAVDTSIYQNVDTLFSNANGNTYQWINCDSSFIPVSGETNQSFIPSSSGNYAVIITENGCIDTSACYYVNIVSLIDNEELGVSIYPNPSTGKFTIRAMNLEEIEIINIEGKQVYFGKENEIDLSQEPKGIYILKVTTINGVAIEKVVLE